MNAADLMRRDVATVKWTDTLEDAVALMAQHGIGSVVVIGRSGLPVGMITDRDVCLIAYRMRKSLADLRVSTWTTQGLFTCRSGDSIGRVEELMSLHRVRRLAVVSDMKQLVGLISLDDIAVEAWRQEDKLARHWLAQPVSSAAVGATLGQIARGRLQNAEAQP